jgi:hypothetical protein
MDSDTERIERIVRTTSEPESVREPEEVLLVDRVQQRDLAHHLARDRGTE